STLSTTSAPLESPSRSPHSSCWRTCRSRRSPPRGRRDTRGPGHKGLLLTRGIALRLRPATRAARRAGGTRDPRRRLGRRRGTEVALVDLYVRALAQVVDHLLDLRAVLARDVLL